MKKMKNVISKALVFSLMAVMLTACSPKDKKPTEQPKEQKSAEQTTGTQVEGEAITISLFAGSIPENTPTGQGIKSMAEYINQNSNGTIKAEAFYDTALGDATSMVQGLQQGTIDVGVCGTSYYSGLIPDIDVYQLPFLFGSLEEARKATSSDSESVKAIFAKMNDKGLVGLCLYENGFRELSNNVRPIKTPDDVKGIKMRTLPSDVQVATWDAMGALTTSIDAAELYTALQQGTVQAQDNPLHEIASRKFYEVQKYITMTDAVYTPLLMAMSKSTYEKMSESQRALIVEAAQHSREVQLKATDEKQSEAKDTLIKGGCEIEENPDKEAFKEKAMPTWKIFTDKNGTEILDMIRK